MKRLLFSSMSALMIFALTATDTIAKENRVKEKLKAVVSVKVNWDIDNPARRDQGHLHATVRGVYVLDDRFTSTEQDLPPIFIAYRNQGVKVQYDYFQEVTDKKPPEECKGPQAARLAKYEGNGTVGVPPLSGNFELSIHYPRAMLESMGIMDIVRRMGAANQDGMGDTLLYTVPGPKVTVTGTKRENCKQVPTEMEISVAPLTIQALLDEAGELSGGDSWTHIQKSGSVDFNVRLRQSPGKDKREEYSPKYDPGGNVNYAVTWSFEKPTPLVIQRKDGEKWGDLEIGDLSTVTVGEMVELRGVVLPEKDKPVAGKWTIDENPAETARNYIAHFDADEEHGEVVHVQDFDQQIIKFCWFRGEEGKVKFETAESPSLSQTVNFKIKRPEFQYSWSASKESKFGPIGKGDPRLANQIRWHNLKHLRGKTGLQYQGILFRADQTSGPQGEGQWVQLIDANYKSFYTANGRRWSTEDNRMGLDFAYPMEKGSLAYDAPAIVMGAIEKNPASFSSSAFMTMKLYFMFRPYDKDGNPSRDNEWVPMHLFQWGWSGKIARPDAQSPWDEEWSYEPDGTGVPVKGEDVDTYPIWTTNADGRARTEEGNGIGADHGNESQQTTETNDPGGN